jgi:hypothetical protein
MERQSEPLTTRDLAGGTEESRTDDDATALPPREADRTGDRLDEPAVTEPARDGGPYDVDADRDADVREPAAREAGTASRTGSEWSGGAADAGTAEPAATSSAEATTEPGTGADPTTEPAAGGTTGPATADRGADPAAETAELLPEGERSDLQRQWEGIQTGFVDEPRQTVEQADALVATVMQRLAEGFAQERERLEQQWGRGEDISTEDLRVALQRYRSFFQRLLSA